MTFVCAYYTSKIKDLDIAICHQTHVTKGCLCTGVQTNMDELSPPAPMYVRAS